MNHHDTRGTRTPVKSLAVLAICHLLVQSFAASQNVVPPPARIVTEYALTSAQDSSNPDPRAWRLLGSNDNGKSWAVLDVQSNQTFKARSQRRAYHISNQSPYNTYRLELDGATEVALAELELIGPVVGVTNEVELRIVASASGEHPLIGPASQAFDGDPSTKWVDFGTSDSKTRWIQCKYTLGSELLVTNINQLLVLARRTATRSRVLDRAPEILENLALSSRQPIRPLVGYALTSANDVPARDPRDWKFLGSTDGGKTWEVLDERRNERFARRFQRRAFTLSKPAGCAIYRLEIDSICVPGAADADSVQIAEIEPLYAANGPTGRFSVVVLAQGENPPLELAEKAFDGDVRTKWLDFGESSAATKSGGNTNRSSWIQWQYLPDAGLPVINLNWLKTVRARPAQPVNLQIEGIVVAWDQASKTLGLVDQTGFQLLELQSPVDQLKPGQRVRLYGQPDFRSEIPLVQKPRVELLGLLSEMSGARPAEISSETNDFLTGEAEGRVTSISEGPSYTVVELAAQHGRGHFIAKVLNPAHTGAAFSEGSSLRVNGVIQRVLDGSGARVEGVIWVPGFDRVSVAAAATPTEHTAELQSGQVSSGPAGVVTKVQQVYDLFESQPRKSYPVSLKGVVTYIDLGLSSFYLQDAGDGILIDGLLGAGLAPFLQQEGLYVELHGETSTNQPAVTATAVARVLGRGQMPDPARPSWDDLMTGRDFGKWVEAEGVVREVSGHRLVVGVPGGRLMVWINELGGANENRLFGSLVRIRGVCAPVANSRNVQLGIRLLVPSLEHVQVLKAAPDNPFDLRSRPIASLLRGATERKANGTRLIKTTGVVTYAEPRVLFVQDGEHGLRVFLRTEAFVEPGDRVELVGFAEPDGLSAKLEEALVRRIDQSSLPSPIPIDLPDFDASDSDATRGQVVAVLRGQSMKDGRQILELQDDRTGMSFSAFLLTNKGILAPVPVGSRLRLQGVFKAELDDLPDFDQAVTSIEMYASSPEDVVILQRPSWWTGQNTLRVAAALAAVLLASLAWVVLLRTKVKHRTSELRTEVAMRTKTEQELQSSRARLQLQIDRMPIACITWSPQFRVTSWNPAAERIFGFRSDEALGLHPFGLIVTEGSQAHVEAVWQRLLDGDAQAHSVNENQTKDGRTIICEWTNTPLRGVDGAVLGVLSMVQDVTERQRAETELAYERDLLTTLLENVPVVIYFKDCQSRFVRFSESFRQKFNVPSSEALQGKTDFDFFTGDHARPAFEDEQRIVSTGQPMIGKIERETHQDGRITWAMTSKMPWHDKDGNIIGTFGVSQNITAIKDAEARLEIAHKQLIDISRQAGMAEVATSVLHNVGNVLNSVNVCSTLVSERLRKSKLSQLHKVVAMLLEHEGDLPVFLATDTKGRQLPRYLARLADQLSADQSMAIQELRELADHIEHIKDIVAMQQSYGRVSGVMESVQVSEVVDTALRINAGSLTRHGIEIVREFEPRLSQMSMDRHKVLQILVNLIRNAKLACDESGRSDRRLTVRVANGSGSVKISVTDNGVGIPRENLTRIFQYGFTTRKNGHGYGLHSGALAAKEMGGALNAHSDGPGTGATFVLELPLALPSNQCRS